MSKNKKFTGAVHSDRGTDMKLATVLREELALNPHNNDEAHMRCTDDECVAALVELGVRVVDATAIRAAFKELDEAAYELPIPKEWLADPSVERFNLAKHRIHVLLHKIGRAHV